MEKILRLFWALSPCIVQASMVTSKVYVELGAGAASLFSDAQGVTEYTPFYNPQIALPAASPFGAVLSGYDVTSMGSSWGNLSMIGALRLGADWRLPESAIVLGAYVNGGVSGAHARNFYVGLLSNAISTVSQPRYVTVSEHAFLGAGFKFGLASGERSLFFATLGWSIRNIKTRFGGYTTYVNPAVASGATVPIASISGANVFRTKSDWINCLVTGLGLDLNLTPNWILGLICEVNIGARKTFAYGSQTFTMQTGQYDTLAIKIKPTISQCLVTLKYALPTCGGISLAEREPVCIPEPICAPEPVCKGDASCLPGTPADKPALPMPPLPGTTSEPTAKN